MSDVPARHAAALARLARSERHELDRLRRELAAVETSLAGLANEAARSARMMRAELDLEVASALDSPAARYPARHVEERLRRDDARSGLERTRLDLHRRLLDQLAAARRLEILAERAEHDRRSRIVRHRMLELEEHVALTHARPPRRSAPIDEPCLPAEGTAWCSCGPIADRTPQAAGRPGRDKQGRACRLRGE